MTARRTKLGADRTAPSILLALLLASSLSVAHAATLRVGPGEAITRIAEAARLAKDGDIRIENIEFRGARVSDRNGAGIRFEKGKLLVRNCSFLDNQNGILTANFGDAELTIENSLPNGGIATLIGNIVGQSDKTQNPVVISYGEEGNTWPENRLTLAHNTLYSERLTGTWFLRAPFDKFPDPPKVLAINNLTAGLGLFTLAARGDFHGNLPALPNLLAAPDILDFSLPKSSPLRLLGFIAEKLPDELIPKAEFNLPIGTRPLATPDRWLPGALQTSQWKVGAGETALNPPLTPDQR